MEKERVTRRWFIMSSAALAAGTMTNATAAGRPGAPAKVPRPEAKPPVTPPSEKLNVAAIGAGGKGSSDIRGAGEGNNVVALCDADWRQAAESFERFPDAKRYKDFREMLDKEHQNIDAVTISTPDNVHAVAAMACMQLGKHVYVQKPLTHDIYEARMLTEGARKYKVATQMGNQGHSDMGIRRVCEWVWAGRIGDVKEVHIWTNRPVWPQGIPRPTDTPPVPEGLDWDVWLGPAPERPYNPAYVPFKWRGWWDFGCGALGDMGCHIMDAAFTSLKLGYPTSVSAEQEGSNEETGPTWSIVTYQFPERKKLELTGVKGKKDFPAVKVVWYDGGKKPPMPEGLAPDTKLGDGDNGSLFIGDKGMLTCGEYAGSPRLVPYEKPEVERFLEKSPGHYEEWIQACKGGAPAGGNFDYAGPFSEMVLLGNLAIRAGQPLDWDGENMKCTNVPEANQYVKREYRKGWSL
ncbi:MAG TPA: Gfo/Idh/MocA family oxidoreductase [Candidatus Hydrogenedentes bacterium]|nr:Gfo/Idh/MocA family oxidoreductase [Candidatus Hydrogenedentota bacterium]HPG69770.1 Gfo/Idh/MocA family oxidoreductase [Candidatus Hydrogenedentota bacterium]